MSHTKAQASNAGKVPIYIDGTKYHPAADHLTGEQLRLLPVPPVGNDRDLWLDTTGPLDDLIENDQVVELTPNMRFHTVPRVINPGQSCGA